ncbi:MAG: hypothetical protein POELPBGB_02877 [Bacteroidia bacterium]|nr:hypothetical protein [Bacteroidia bacterium]
MHNTVKTNLLTLTILAFSGLMSNCYSQCDNADFSNNDFTSWVGRTGSCCGINTPSVGIVNGRHTIMTGAGTDPIACNDITLVAPGYAASARLGNSNVGAEAERLLYTYNVTAASALFTYQYAVVLEDPGHSVADQPRFEIRVLNANGQLVSQQCGYYAVTAAANIQGFRNCGGVRYRAWTPVGIDLSAYIGQNITIEFSTGDCALGGHFGYAYIVAECNPLELAVDYCPANSNVATLTAPSGFEYQWNTGATSQSIQVSNPINGAQYSCLLTAVTGCQVTVSADIAATAINTDFTNTIACPGEQIQFTDITNSNIGTIVSWDWDFGDGNTSVLQNPTHTYASSGIYSVTLTTVTSNNCEGTITKPVDINPYPVANFTAPPVCESFQVNFENGTLFPNTIGAWSWDFGDGSPPNTTIWDAAHSYPAGNYNATLICYSQNLACTDTFTAPVVVSPLPTADYTYTDVCHGNPVVFTNTSQGTISNSTWNFGDNSIPLYINSPSHIFISSGNYNTTLTVTSSDGCVDSITQVVTVTAQPQTQFSFNNACEGEPVNFTNQSTISPPFLINEWEWDFGDGSPVNSTDWEPQHVYNTAGTYYIRLITWSDNLVCSDTLIDSVYVYPQPLVDFSFNNVCLNTPMDFTNLSQGEISDWDWNFGDGSPHNFNMNISHSYPAPGNYDATLIATTIYGCIDSVSQSVTIYSQPQADFTFENVCHETITDFTDLSTTPAPGTIVSWQWNFADATPFDNNASASHLYANPGNYNVVHTVISNDGCVDSIIKTVVVHPNPVVDFIGEPEEGCSPLFVDFQDLSGILTGVNASWNWTFGDVGSSTEQNPTYAFINFSTTMPAIFDVTLQVTSDQGCETILRKENYITVYPIPKAGFTFSPQVTTVVYPQIEFTDLSQEATQWSWHFGDNQVNNTSTFQNPVYNYLDTGVFTITQVVYNDYRCSDTLRSDVIINPDVVIYIPNAFSPNANGVNDRFTINGTGITAQQMRIFDRWGELLYYTEDIESGWDGTIQRNGEKAKQDMYVYTITVLDLVKAEHKFYGYVMLLR